MTKMSRRSPKRVSQGPLWELATNLGGELRQSIAHSWLIRLSLGLTIAVLLLFLGTRAADLFVTAGFGPHGACLLWIPGLITLYAGSDTLIGLAYVSISATLIYLVYMTRRTIPFQWVFVAFGIFIIACGTTHFLDVVTLWIPVYWLLGTVKALTALASVITALLLPPLIPRVSTLVQLAHVSDKNRRQLEQAHRELALLYEKSQELDRLKTAFFANVSHELRTPLTLILGPMRALLDDGQLKAEQQQALEVMQRNAMTLLKQVNDLLDLAQLDMGKMALHVTEADLAHVLRECAAHFVALARERHLTFIVEGPDSLPASLDVEKFRHICLNLLSNAFKFTPVGGTIRYILSQEDGRAILALHDSGPGVSLDQRQVIFERFRQGERDQTRHVGGTGLGLAIVKEFVELHGGTITVGDSQEGGALFLVEMPLQVQPEHQHPVPTSEPPVTSEMVTPYLSLLRLTMKPERPVEQAIPVETLDDTRPLVLIIEDHEEMATFLEQTLCPLYRTARAGDGEVGLMKALALQPDLILCDLMMPRMDGEQFIAHARTHRVLETVPIVVLSARVDDDLRIRLLREGIQDYLIKPFFSDELRVRIANLITMRQARQVLQEEVVLQNENLVILAKEVALRKRESQQALEELQQANEQLLHASQIQRNFVAIVSHEFRTALTGIQGFSEIMRSEELSHEEIQEYASDIFMEAKRLGRLIADLLDLERMKSGRMSLNLELLDLNGLLREVSEHQYPMLEDHQLELQLELELPACLGDRDKLTQVLTNLLSNAIKYSPGGGNILLKSEVKAGQIQICVQDQGLGIPPEALEEVFVSYSRIEAEPTRYIKGSGLGLSITRQIVQMHGGRIWVESRVGEGSRFFFTLPLSEREVTRQVEDRVLEQKRISFESHT